MVAEVIDTVSPVWAFMMFLSCCRYRRSGAELQRNGFLRRVELRAQQERSDVDLVRQHAERVEIVGKILGRHCGRLIDRLERNGSRLRQPGIADKLFVNGLLGPVWRKAALRGPQRNGLGRMREDIG